MSLRTAYPTFIHLLTFRWWTWRLTRRLLFACAVLATLIALVYAVENWRGRRAFAAVAREAAAAGLSFNLADHAPPPVPDALNLAKISLLEPPLNEAGRTRFWQELEQRLGLQPPAGSTAVYPPSDGSPDFLKNQAADFARLRAAFQTATETRDSENLDAYLYRVAPILSELATACATRPHLQFDSDWSRPYWINLRHIGAMRLVSQAAALQSLVHLENQRPTEAALALAIPLHLGSALRSDPLLISQLGATGISDLGYGVLWQGQLRHQWTHDDLDHSARLLAQDRILSRFQQSYLMEGAAAIAVSLQLAEPSSAPVMGEEMLETDTQRTLNRVFGLAPAGWAHQNAARIGRAIIHETLPSIDANAARVTPRTSGPEKNENRLLQPYRVLEHIFLPSFDKFTLTAGRGKTANDLARLAVALEQHFLAHGAYPDSLAPVLATDPALAALHDPFDGKPYRYRRDPDGGFTLWGVGQNLRDDGGAFPGKKGPRADYDTGDLVWRIPGR
jgi:hypothetical protein